MPITDTPQTAAQVHFLRAFRFYDSHHQAESAIGEMAAGLLALSAQVARIERAVSAERVG